MHTKGHCISLSNTSTGQFSSPVWFWWSFWRSTEAPCRGHFVGESLPHTHGDAHHFHIGFHASHLLDIQYLGRRIYGPILHRSSSQRIMGRYLAIIDHMSPEHMSHRSSPHTPVTHDIRLLRSQSALHSAFGNAAQPRHFPPSCNHSLSSFPTGLPTIQLLPLFLTVSAIPQGFPNPPPHFQRNLSLPPGHSKGGALAALTSMWLAKETGIRFPFTALLGFATPSPPQDSTFLLILLFYISIQI